MPKLALARRSPVELVTDFVLFAIPVFYSMRPLLGPYYERNEGRKPQDGVDNIDQGVSVRVCKAFRSLENGKSRLIDQGWYAKPALSHQMSARSRTLIQCRDC